MIPDFLTIGAQKSCTTWLDRNLRVHPEIWLPPEKEIHYFDFPPLMPFFFLLMVPVRSVRNWAKNRMIRDYRKVKEGQQSLSWYVRYYFLLRTKRWYLSLFTPDSGKISGETTPRYALLSVKRIAKVHALMPNSKIIYLLRNPIDRMWSDIAMFHSTRFGYDGIHAIDEERIVKFLKKSKHLAHSRYLDNLQRWEQFFPASQIFVGFYEEVSEQPQQLIKNIYQFLGVKADDRLVPKKVAKKINVNKYPKLPPHIAHILAELLIDDVEKLHQRFNNAYTLKWLEETQGYLGQGK